MSAYIILFCAFALCLIILYVIYLSNKNFALQNKIKDVMHQKAEIGNFLTLFSQNLRNIEEIDSSMNTTARYIADLVEAESVCIYEVIDDYLCASGVSGAFPLAHHGSSHVMTRTKYLLESLRREKIRFGQGIIGKAGERREPLLIENAREDIRLAEFENSGVDSVMVVPMVHDAELTGVICAVNNRRSGPFAPEQFSRLRFISFQVILAQNLVQVYRELSTQQRINQELEFARRLQSSMLPESFPDWKRFAVHAFTHSSKEVNGDFYDFVEIDANRRLIVLGDACGKGIPACMLTAMTRSFIRSATEHFTTLENFLLEINNNLFRDTDEECFITLGCCLLDCENSLVEYARAGHTELMIHTHDHIRIIYPDGSALGLLPNELALSDTICLEFKDDMSLLLFSDGLTEALNGEGEEFGVERLQKQFFESCRKHDHPDDTISKIFTAVNEFAPEQFDDQTLVLISRPPE